MPDEKEKAKTKYVPDYDYECDVCGQVPTVTMETNGVQMNHLEMCGPCTFGEAACLDVDNWN